jgi:hypothetical protein
MKAQPNFSTKPRETSSQKSKRECDVYEQMAYDMLKEAQEAQNTNIYER